MKRFIPLAIITVFWGIMMTLWIRHEYFEFHPLESSYQIIPLTSTPIREEFHTIQTGNALLGFAYTSLKKSAKSGQYEFTHKNYLHFNLLGQGQEMYTQGKAELDARLHLQSFQVNLRHGDVTDQLQGKRTPEGMHVRFSSKNKLVFEKDIPLSEPVYHSESLDFLWTEDNLRAGQKGRFLTFNPLTLLPETVEFEITGKVKSKSGTLFILHLYQNHLKSIFRVTPEGDVAGKELPSGLTFTKEPGWKIFDALNSAETKKPDIPHLFSIPAGHSIPENDSLSYFKGRLHLRDEIKEFEIRREDLSPFADLSFPFSFDTEPHRVHLASTPVIRADSDEIKKIAAKLSGGQTQTLPIIRRILRWIHQNMRPALTQGLASTEKILEIRKGDSDEYTLLFTAIARAAGIPARTVTGLLYQGDRFFYYTWPEVFIGRWIGADPAQNRFPVSAAYIPLFTGDLKPPSVILDIFSQLKIEVLETN